MSAEKQNFFDGLACSWDERFYGDDEVNLRLDALAVRFDVKPGFRVMDLGCGTGIMSGRLSALAGEEGKVFSCDFSMKMLEMAMGKSLNAVSICSDAHCLPFKDKFFDRVVSFSCFPHFDDKPRVLKEAGRVLKDGGVLVISHLLGSRELAGVHKRTKDAVSMDRLPSKKTMLMSLVKAGFRVLEFRDEKGFYLLRARKHNGVKSCIHAFS
jgi:demethylmenaquinone methyltransferase/2-methoxy-6-polyprenyl-1,4-benzoquinol methylase